MVTSFEAKKIDTLTGGTRLLHTQSLNQISGFETLPPSASVFEDKPKIDFKHVFLFDCFRQDGAISLRLAQQILAVAPVCCNNTGGISVRFYVFQSKPWAWRGFGATLMTGRTTMTVSATVKQHLADAGIV